jgi:hypothetical protein
MTDEQQETIVNEVLLKFCHYLNDWWNSEPFNKEKAELDPYTPKKFTVTDPEDDLYGETDWTVLEEPNMQFAFPTGLMKINCTDGDEGGGNILYVGLQGHLDETIEISWISHTFDLSTFMIWTDAEGYRTSPTGLMQKEI